LSYDRFNSEQTDISTTDVDPVMLPAMLTKNSIIMKKTILITALMALTFFANSQTFIQENKTWNVVECMNFGGCKTQTFIIMGDTIIEQLEYKKLYATYDTTLNTWSNYGAMREIENQVFFYLYANETEEMLYDFNLAVGDTFNTIHNSIGCSGCPIELVVTSIDTVTLENGEQKQRFNFADGEQWISGIGSLYGLVYVGVYQCIMDMYYDLSCCHENDELIYQSQFFDNCFINTVGLKENSEQIKHSVYPNPFSQSTELKFDYSSSQIYRLQIISGTGQIVIEIENINSDKIIIHGDQLNSGIHFYRLTNNGKEIATGKLIKIE